MPEHGNISCRGSITVAPGRTVRETADNRGQKSDRARNSGLPSDRVTAAATQVH